jgi:multiple sugar transport system permease protein
MTRRYPSLVPLLLIAPGFLLALAVISYPFFDLMRISLHDVSRFGQLRAFNDGANFMRVFADPLFLAALWRTIIWTVLVVGGTLLISLPVALILNENFIGRGVARTIVMLPWSVSLTMTAIVWRWALNGDFGLLNATLQSIGVIDTPLVWLASADLAFPMQVLIGVLVSVPFTVTIFLGGLSSVPGDIYEAAKLDGATGFQQFRTLTLPLMKPFVTMAIVLNVIYVFNSFPIIWVLTQGGPADGTHILVTYLYHLAFRLGKLGEAAAVSLVMLAILLAFTALYVKLVGKEQD